MHDANEAAKHTRHWSDRIRSASGRKALNADAKCNQRWATRRKSDLPALISSDALQSPVRCYMRDHSSTGAFLQITSEPDRRLEVDDVPDRFMLYLLNNRAYVGVQCVVVRRFGDCIGVRYAGGFHDVARKRGAVLTRR